MKCVIFGLGLIGVKHANILTTNFGAEVYSFNSNHTSDYIKKNIIDSEELKSINFDFIIISNPTSLHLSTLKNTSNLNCPVFLEKPIDSNIKNLNEITELYKKNKVPIYLAYCLRFNPVVNYVYKYLKKHEPQLITITNSNNLDCWPRKDGKGYSTSFDAGGGIVLDLSHEIDYLHYISPIKKVIYSKASKNGNVTNDAPDFLLAEFETEKCRSVVQLNYHGHVRERKVKIDFAEHSIVGDLRNHTIEIYEKLNLKETIKFDGTYDSMYNKQWKYFIDNKDNPKIMNNIDEASYLFSVLCKINTRG